jgi:hypothetical protein
LSYVLRYALGLFFVAGIGCGGEDPVLRAARLAQEADVASGSAVESHVAGSVVVEEADHGGHPIDGGVAGNNGNGGVAGNHEAGVPGDPAIGRPDQPPPGLPGSVEVGEPGQPSLMNGGDSPPSNSEMVTLQGQILMSDYRHGDLRIDVFDGDHRSHVGQRPALVMSQTVSSTGQFTIQVPLLLEEVWIEVSNDENGDGRPGPRDPSGLCARNPIDISNGLVSGLMIEIVRQEAPPGGVGAEL